MLKTEGFLRGVATVGIADATDAVLVDCTIRDGGITIKIDGEATTEELRLFTHAYRNLLDAGISHLSIERPSGEVLYREEFV